MDCNSNSQSGKAKKQARLAPYLAEGHNLLYARKERRVKDLPVHPCQPPASDAENEFEVATPLEEERHCLPTLKIFAFLQTGATPSRQPSPKPISRGDGEQEWRRMAW
ncbi:unnamed protein product [Penicillium bialowiezense]